jgi:hypothetical protein
MADQCPKCGSKNVIPPEAAWLHAGNEFGQAHRRLTVSLQRDPDAILLKEQVDFRVAVFVCGDCGVLEMFAEGYRDLWKAYEASR